MWPDRLERAIKDGTLLKRIFVLRQTQSTQDAARRMNAAAGDVLVAWRQTAGRGRLGRAWADTGEDGAALTIALHVQRHREALAIACAVGVARAAEMLLQRPVGIKWPNDIIVDGRKLAGILIEQHANLTLIGIGLNVRQQEWPADLTDRAVSLAQAGSIVDRVDVIAALLASVDDALHLDESRLIAEYGKRDVLRGTRATFRSNDREITGIVLRVDPLRGLAVQTHTGDVWLGAATTSVVPN
jgi:BirA family biotin operon repressor/biotin-[acetyl-CoA-carboxylase] ligase